MKTTNKNIKNHKKNNKQVSVLDKIFTYFYGKDYCETNGSLICFFLTLSIIVVYPLNILWNFIKFIYILLFRIPRQEPQKLLCFLRFGFFIVLGQYLGQNLAYKFSLLDYSNQLQFLGGVLYLFGVINLLFIGVGCFPGNDNNNNYNYFRRLFGINWIKHTFNSEYREVIKTNENILKFNQIAVSHRNTNRMIELKKQLEENLLKVGITDVDGYLENLEESSNNKNKSTKFESLREAISFRNDNMKMMTTREKMIEMGKTGFLTESSLNNRHLTPEEEEALGFLDANLAMCSTREKLNYLKGFYGNKK